MHSIIFIFRGHLSLFLMIQYYNIRRKNLTITISRAFPIEAPNLMCEIGMSFYQYWHQLMHF